MIHVDSILRSFSGLNKACSGGSTRLQRLWCRVSRNKNTQCTLFNADAGRVEYLSITYCADVGNTDHVVILTSNVVHSSILCLRYYH